MQNLWKLGSVGIFFFLLLAPSLPCLAAVDVSLHFDRECPRIVFAAGELQRALESREHAVAVAPLEEAGTEASGTRIVLTTRTVQDGAEVPSDLKPEGFSIRRVKDGSGTTYWVVGVGEGGAMYGGLELAEMVLCRGLGGVRNADQSPYMALRGIKYNCPLDERTPTYHAHGGEAQWENVLVMWDMEFWKNYIDELARMRYNYLSLWNLHPFPSMVRVPGYERVALTNVESTKETLAITMDEKIAFWRNVMRYAKDRNVDVYVVTWNIFVKGTDGQYGLTDKFDNPTTTDYFRKSVKQMFLTYPDLAGIGLTTGERMPGLTTEQKENWALATYGQGVLDVAKAQPGRKIKLIHRQHQTGARDIIAKFQELVDHPDIDFLPSFKYAKAHVMSSTRQPFCKEYVKEIAGLETIWTLRNDSNYYFRWGAPDFVREFVKNIPHEVSRGYYYGSDGHTWGREFLSTDPEEPRQLDIRKHWYHWMLWGRLGYDPSLGNKRLVEILAARFPDINASNLFLAWQSASMVYPTVTGFHWGALDFQWYIEGCISRPRFSFTKSGFHDIERFITLEPHPGTDNVSIPDFVATMATGNLSKGTTPVDVAKQVHEHADSALTLLENLDAGGSKELRRTLGDIRAMAYLGKYYAHKIRGATELALFRKTAEENRKIQAVREMTEAASWWDKYVAVAISQYVNPIDLNRVGTVDWRAITFEVQKDITIAREATVKTEPETASN